VRLVPNDAGLFNDLGVAYLLTRRVPEAILNLQRSVSLNPRAARTHFNYALALEQANRIDAAISAFRQAALLAPDLVEAHARAADLLNRQGKRDDAIAAYERAVQAAPSSPLARLCSAKALVLRGQPSQAEPILQSLSGSNASGEVNLVLGLIQSDAGRFDEAATSFERCLAAAPWQAVAYHGLVTSRRMSEADRPLLDRILSRAREAETTESQRMTLHFAAGKALDDLADYAGAIEQFDAANRIRLRLAPFDRAGFIARVDRVVARFTREFLVANAAVGAPDETPVLVLGMPRSGTTLIERAIASHPLIAGGGELPYWNDHASATIDAPLEELVRSARELREGYLRVLRDIGPDAARVTDKMPFNFLWLGLVHLLLPGARFVHCRRDPIDTCLSIYSTRFEQNWGFASDRAELAAYYRQYLRLMDHWRAVLPPGRLLEVDYEEATADFEVVARRLVEFCGLPWDPACSRPERNSAPIRTASKWQARQGVYRTSVERWRHYEPWLGELRGLAGGDREQN
jgi:tetratricopeptide (TPR) repeat protein